MRVDEPGASDAAFERALLESARDDGPPAGATAAAWAKFASAGAVVASGVGVNAEPARRADGSAWLRGSPAAPVKWLVLGALGGSILTAAWLQTRAARHGLDFTTKPAPAASSPLAAIASSAPSTPHTEPKAPSRAAESTPGVRAPLQARANPQREVPARGAAITSKGGGVGAEQALERVDTSAKAGSRLAAEVAALDAVRAALAIGAPERALEGIDAYRRDFPEGALTPEAHVLEVEALAAQGNRAGARRAAERFLARYPNDPHVTRIRWLAEQ